MGIARPGAAGRRGHVAVEPLEGRLLLTTLPAGFSEALWKKLPSRTDVARTQQQLKLNQWINPLVSGAIIVLGAWHEEQQRTSQVVPGVVKGVAGRPAILLPALAATAVGVLASRRSKASSGSNGPSPGSSSGSTGPTSASPDGPSN